MSISFLSRLTQPATDAVTIAAASQPPLWPVAAAALTEPMSEKQLLTRLFRLTRDMATMRNLCSGLHQLSQATAYRLGYTLATTHELRWPLQITVQRNRTNGTPILAQQGGEPLAVINAGPAGNLRYQSGTTHRLFTPATLQTAEQVLNHLRRQACQQHFL